MSERELLLSLACGRYDRTTPLADGRVVPEGARLNYLPLIPQEIFWRMLKHEEFDVSEMSVSSYFTLRSRGDERFVALPVFPSRAFRHSAFYIHADSGICEPADLRGRRVGCVEYALTTSVWARGILHHEYRVAPHEVIWLIGGQEEPGREERISLSLPPDVRTERIPSHRTLTDMLDKGEIDALIAPSIPSAWLAGSPHIKRLFPDFKAEEQAYYRRTGIFPVMHTVVLRGKLHREHTWLAQSLYKAFCRAKDLALIDLYDTNTLIASVAWLVAAIEEARAVLGPDLWPYGIEANRATLETLKTYMAEQGLLERDFALEEAFAASTLDAYRN